MAEDTADAVVGGIIEGALTGAIGNYEKKQWIGY